MGPADWAQWWCPLWWQLALFGGISLGRLLLEVLKDQLNHLGIFDAANDFDLLRQCSQMSISMFKVPYRNGTTHVIFEPMDFIAKLAALVPKPHVNLTRFHGVFAPNSQHHAQVTPAKRGKKPNNSEVPDTGWGDKSPRWGPVVMR